MFHTSVANYVIWLSEPDNKCLLSDPINTVAASQQFLAWELKEDILGSWLWTASQGWRQIPRQRRRSPLTSRTRFLCCCFL